MWVGNFPRVARDKSVLFVTVGVIVSQCLMSSETVIFVPSPIYTKMIKDEINKEWIGVIF